MSKTLRVMVVGVALSACRPSSSAPTTQPELRVVAPAADVENHTDAPKSSSSTTAEAVGGRAPLARHSPALAPAKKQCARAEKIELSNPDFRFVEQRIADLMKKTGTPGLAVAVGHQGKLVWERGFGWADRERKRRATADTMFSLASISKPFTATAIMVLVERGQVDLDAPINTYLGAAGVWAGAGDPNDATVRRVMNHTAGLPGFTQFYYVAEGERPLAHGELNRRHAMLARPPGEGYHYSNIGYGLLGDVVEAVSGQAFATFMRTAVFAPLGLTHTSVGISLGAERLAASRYWPGGEPVAAYALEPLAAGGMYSSAHDLVEFASEIMGVRSDGNAIISPTTRAEMMKLVPPSETYGLGWAVRRLDGAPHHGHNGTLWGAATTLDLFPDQGIAIAIVANSRGFVTEFPSVLDELGIALDMPARSDDLCNLPPQHDVFGRWLGSVQTPAAIVPLALDITTTGELNLRVANGPKTTVRRVALEKDQMVTGVLRADLGYGRGSEALRLDVKLRDDRLQGVLTATTDLHGWQPHWVTLEREGATVMSNPSLHRRL